MEPTNHPYSISSARANLYRVVDQVLATGEPALIKRHGRVVRLVADSPVNKLDNLKPHPDYVVGDPDELIHMDWSSEWNPDS